MVDKNFHNKKPGLLEPTIFPLEDILTVSAKDYIETRTAWDSTGPSRKYTMQGVHVEGSYIAGQSMPLSNFAKRVPASAEVVVDFRAEISASGLGILNYIFSGTALILDK